MSSYSWRLPAGQLGLFTDLNSWTDEGTGQEATAIPGPGDTIDLGGGAVVGGTGTVDALNLSGVTTIEGTVDATVLYGTYFGQDSTVDIASGGVLQAPNFFLGNTNTTGVQINVAAGGTLQSVGLTAADNDLSIKIGASVGGQAAINVSGSGALLDSGGWAVWIGELGSGTLTIADGAQGGDGTLDNTGSLDYYYSTNIGVKTGGDGTLIVTGPGSTYTVNAVLAVGRASGANGVLVLSDGGTLVATATEPNFNANIDIGESFDATGSATVESGATLDSGPAGMVVGDAGTGTLLVQQGGTVLASNSGFTTLEAALTVGQPGTGYITVDGVGSLVRSDGEIWVGETGTGSLIISNIGTVQVTGAAPNGYANIEAGNEPGGVGAITVTGTNSVLDAGTGRLTIGNFGRGTLNVANGGTVLTSNSQYTDGGEAALRFGTQVGGAGTGTIDGAGSMVRAVGFVQLGDSGTGSLTISDHGTLVATATEQSFNPNIDIGMSFDSTGSATVETGATLDAGPAGMAVGVLGTGTLLVQQGGTVLTSSTGYSDDEPALWIGWAVSGDLSQTGTGIVTVDGAGSLLRADGGISAGENGSGSLTVSNAGTVEVTDIAPNGYSNIIVGDQTGASGTITVTGTNSVLDAGQGHLTIGASGTGVLTVANGGTVLVSAAGYNATYLADDAVAFGEGVGSTGSGTIDGAGSTLAANGAIWVGGDNGAGSLTVSNGANVSAGGTNDGGSGFVVSQGTGSGSVLINGGTLTVSDNGQINGLGSVTLENLGLLSVGGTLTGDGTLDLAGSPAVNTLDGAVTAGIAIDFVTRNALLLGTPLGMAATINGFVAGDQIDTNIAYTQISDSFVGNTLTITSDGATVAALTFASTNDAINTYVTDINNLVVVETTLPCFLTGTKILTTRGEVAVEHVRLGDMVLTNSGAEKPVRWIGQRTVANPQGAQRPVRIAAGAFGAGPARDLYLSADHCVLCGDALVPVKALVNGGNVAFVERRRVTYWHIELETHDIVLAEGFPVESYLDTGNRAAFAGGRVTQLHPDFGPGRVGKTPCRPIVTEGPAVVAAKTWLLDGLDWTSEPDLHLRSGTQEVRADRYGDWFGFILPGGPVQLRSRSAVAGEVWAASCDPRRLGLAVTDIFVDGRAIALDDARLGAGWHEPEAGVRWTDGDAVLDVAEAVHLDVRIVQGAMRFPARRHDHDVPVAGAGHRAGARAL